MQRGKYDAIYNLDHSGIVCLMEYTYGIIMDNAQAQSFEVFACLFIRIVDVEAEYVDNSDYNECIQCYLECGATIIFGYFPRYLGF